MKLMLLSLAGVIAASAVTPVPANAQRWRDGSGWHHDDRYWHGGRNYWRPRGYHGERHRRGRGWGWPQWGGGRTVCRWRHGRYGAVRRCYRVRW